MYNLSALGHPPADGHLANDASSADERSGLQAFPALAHLFAWFAPCLSHGGAACHAAVPWFVWGLIGTLCFAVIGFLTFRLRLVLVWLPTLGVGILGLVSAHFHGWDGISQTLVKIGRTTSFGMLLLETTIMLFVIGWVVAFLAGILVEMRPRPFR